MNRQFRVYSLLATLVLTGLFFTNLTGCFRTEPRSLAGGGGVETTEGNLASLDGVTAGAHVRLVPVDYDASQGVFPESLTTTADAKGLYFFKGIHPGRYNLDIVHSETGMRAFRKNILLVKGQKNIKVTDTLKPPGKVILFWEGRRSGHLFQKGRLYHRTIETESSETNFVVLDSLPEGSLPPFYHRDFSPDSTTRALTDTISVGSGTTQEIGAFGEWKYAAELSMDLASTGIDLGSEVSEFPLLVRLNATLFDFAQAANDGKDIRFSGKDGQPLAYGIERWDAPGGKAEIWVRVKKIQGGIANQKIFLYWGNASAKNRSDQGAVFDTSLGFSGVWHLSEATGVDSTDIRDATPNRLEGPMVKLIQNAASSSLIGISQRFDGKRGYAYILDTFNLADTGPFMISAWIQPSFEANDSLTHAIAAKWEEKDSAGFRLTFAPEIPGFRFELGLDSPRRVFTAEVGTQGFLPPDWHQVVASYDGREVRIYWDGKSIFQGLTGAGNIVKNPRDLILGGQGDVNASLAEIDLWKGGMDEVRLYRGMKDATWIRLDYQSQNPSGFFLHFSRLR